MINPWFWEDLNDAMKSKKTKEAMERGESVYLSEMYPLCTFVLILLLIIGVYKLLPLFLKCLPLFQSFFNIIVG